MVGRIKGAAGARRRRSFVLVALAAIMVPAAIAWACNPQAHLSLNKSTYSPGEAISVSGSYFNSSGSYTVSTSGSSGAASGSAWSVGLTAPSQPGSYTVVAASSGGYISGLPKTASFQVVDPTVSEPTPGDEGPSGQTFREPNVGGTGNAGNAGNVGGVGGGAGSVPTGSGQQAFAGSVPAAAGGGAFFSAGGGASTATQPSERAAASDVWSGYAAGKTPSLTAGSAALDGETGSQISIGIVLLSIGLLALVAVLTTAEVMRRRARIG